MKVAIVAMALLAALGSGCSPTCRDTSLYQRTGQVKPVVTVLPVIDRTGSAAPWDFAREFTDEIRKRVFESSKLYLLRDPGSLQLARELNVPHPMQLPADLRGRMGAAEYVVVTELLDQREEPFGHQHGRVYQEESGSVLTVSLRVRVIDVRHNEPRVILQEIVEQEHIVAKPYLKIDYTREGWGSEFYDSTPLGMAHNRVVREVVAHVENYITASR